MMMDQSQEPDTLKPHVEIDEDTLTKNDPKVTSFKGFILRHRKTIFLTYLVLGAALVYIQIMKPDGKTPFLIEIFNR